MINYYSGYPTTQQYGQNYYYNPTPTTAIPPIYANQPTYATPVQPTYTAPTPTGEDYFGWTTGETEARTFNIPGKRRLMLLDSGTNRFYIKVNDESGVPQSFKIYEYNEVAQPTQTPQAPPQNNGQPQKQYNSDFITRGELNKILNERFPKNSHTSVNAASAKETK